MFSTKSTYAAPVSTSNKQISMAFCLVLSIGLLVACASREYPYDMEFVSEGIERSTGFDAGLAVEPGEVMIPDGVSFFEGGVTEDEAVALALWNNAAFQETLADLGFARADLVQAGLIANPVFSLFFPRGPRQVKAALAFPLDAIWLRPSRVAIAEIRAKRVGERLVQNGLDLVRDVRVAYADLALAKDRARLGEEAADLLERIADLSEKRLGAGDVSEFEVTTARIDAIRSRGDTVALARDVDIARHGLKKLLGLGLLEAEIRFGDSSPTLPIEGDVKNLVEDALAARPDMRAADLAVAAASKQIKLSRIEYLKLDFLLDGEKVVDFEVMQGFQMPLPIFNRNQDGSARARAEFDRAMQHHTTVRDQIVLDVSVAHARFLQAEENLELLRARVLSDLEEAVARAEKAYEGGNLSFLLVLETTRRLMDARLKEVEAVAVLRRARAELERSVGRRLEKEAIPAHTP